MQKRPTVRQECIPREAGVAKAGANICELIIQDGHGHLNFKFEIKFNLKTHGHLLTDAPLRQADGFLSLPSKSTKRGSGEESRI